MYDIAEFFPIIWTVLAIHMLLGIYVLMKIVVPKIGSPKELSEVDNKDVKLTMMFDMYRDSFAESDPKPWSYTYAGIFKYLHFLALVLVLLVVANVAMKYF